MKRRSGVLDELIPTWKARRKCPIFPHFLSSSWRWMLFPVHLQLKRSSQKWDNETLGWFAKSRIHPEACVELQRSYYGGLYFHNVESTMCLFQCSLLVLIYSVRTKRPNCLWPTCIRIGRVSLHRLLVFWPAPSLRSLKSSPRQQPSGAAAAAEQRHEEVTRGLCESGGNLASHCAAGSWCDVE